MGLWLNRIRRGFNRSPQELKLRVIQEAKVVLDRYRVSPTFGIDDTRFVGKFGVTSIDELWLQLSEQPYAVPTGQVDVQKLDGILPNEIARIRAAAAQAMSLEVNLLGSGPVIIDRPIGWHTDFKTDFEWPVKFFRDIDILNPGQGSDVKVPWELSRLQWLFPVGQAYLLNPDEKYAEFVRDVLIDWIGSNPYARGVNWAVAMEAALRIYSWTWFFHIFKSSKAWDGYEFRQSFLRSLFEHAVFCERYLEDYGVNGNHCTADAGALVFAGLFFGKGEDSSRWEKVGWQLLERELPLQVLSDGTDFEGSIAYHRFVAEMFFWPARYRLRRGKAVAMDYQQKLRKMVEFTECYIKPDGSVPLWGDSDDGRVLPFRSQDINDHSYLPGMISLEFGDADNVASNNGLAEIFWAGSPIDKIDEAITTKTSKRFDDSGYYIMATERDHVFIDCGSVGFGGRGGHGHNDCLSFDACLDGVSLLMDSGTFAYTASYQQRNEFRSTQAHNTPMIDGLEQNRFINDAELFAFHFDAIPELLEWQCNEEMDIFVGSHSGYQRLNQPVTPVRKIMLEKKQHRLVVIDDFIGNGQHEISTSFHFAPDCRLKEIKPGQWSITTLQKSFCLVYDNTMDWQVTLQSGWVSPQYGVKVERQVLEFKFIGELLPLRVGLYPTETAPDEPVNWLATLG